MQKFIRIYSHGSVHDEPCDTMMFEEARKRVGGYVEVHRCGELTVLCDEEGNLKKLAPSVSICDNIYVGTVLVCKFDNAGVHGVSKKALKAFEQYALVQKL